MAKYSIFLQHFSPLSIYPGLRPQLVDLQALALSLSYHQLLGLLIVHQLLALWQAWNVTHLLSYLVAVLGNCPSDLLCLGKCDLE